MKTFKWLATILVICLLGIVSTGWCSDPVPPLSSEGIITKIEGHKVTLTPENDKSKKVAIEVKETKGFKVGDRVKIQDGKLVKVVTAPTRSGDSRALTPIQLPNVPEGGKVPPGPGGKGNFPLPTPYPEYSINRVEGNGVTLLTIVQVRDPGIIKVGDRVKIHEGNLMKVGAAPTKPGDSRAYTPIQIPNVPEGGKTPPGPAAESKGTTPTKPGDSRALTPIQLPNVPEGGKTPSGSGGKGLMSYPEYSISRIEGNKVTLVTVVQVKDPRVVKVGDRVKIQGTKMVKGEAAPEPLHRPPSK